MSAVAVRPQQAAVPRALAAPRWLRDRPMLLATCLIVALVVVSHGHNMLHYPYLEDDEGTYSSQAWAVFHLGRLSPYTYIYDHAPLGWIQLALWQLITGGVRLNDGLAADRVLMLLFQLGSALLVLAIGRKASGKVWVGLLAAALFSLSTYGILYHRRVLLDNIATFWLLLSLYLLVGRVTLRRVWLSAIAIGVAVLSKEVAVAAIPALAVLVARESPRSNRLFAVSGWLALSLFTCSTYILVALLKGEFFPAGTMLGGHHRHVSLLCSLKWQASRAPDAGLFDRSSAFWKAALSWAHAEPLLVIGGTAAAAVCVVVYRRHPFLSMLGWTVLSLWLFLGRGGIVLPFYLVPLLPLLALAIALVLAEAVAGLHRRLPSNIGGPARFIVLGLAAVGFALLLVLAFNRSDRGLWTKHPVNGQVNAVRWVERHLSPTSRMVIDQYMWRDLHDPSRGAPAFRNADYYWKVADDPEVRHEVFGDSWRNVDYVISTPQLVDDARHNDFPVVVPALEHSVLVAAFDSGWRVEVRRVDPRVPAQFPLPHNHAKPLPGCMNYAS
jgi:4-amino-4-deoxy-L-arabinose transferase-like glycosyltransferase